MRSSWQLGPILRGIRGHRAAAVLVVVQFGIGLAITVLAVLIGDYFSRQGVAPADFAERDLTVVEVQLPGRSAGDDAAARRAAIRADVERTPDVVGATVAQASPLDVLEHVPDDLRAAPTAPPTRVYSLEGGAGFVAVTGLRLRAGRDLTPEDLRAGDLTAALVSAALARAQWPDRDPVGARFTSRAYGAAVVVGVVDDMRTHLFGKEHAGVIYGRDAARAARMVLLVRSAPGRAAAVRAGLLERLQLPGQHAVITAADEQARRRDDPVGTVVGILGTIVATMILVVLVGSMGLTYYLVAERTREVGLRRAMGATRLAVVRHFLLENLILTGAGTVLGLAIVALVLPTLAHAQEDFVVRWPLIALSVVVVVLLNLIATLIPASKAAAVPPVVASRTT